MKKENFTYDNPICVDARIKLQLELKKDYPLVNIDKNIFVKNISQRNQIKQLKKEVNNKLKDEFLGVILSAKPSFNIKLIVA
jgi:hypothetical protein